MAQAAKLPLTDAAKADRRRLRVHGSSWLWLGGGVAFVVVAVLVGITVGPAPIGIGAIVESAASHLPFLDVHSHLSASDSAIVWQLRLPRVVLGLLVGRCSRAQVPPTRASSGTRSSTRTCSASQPEPGSARR